MNNEGVLLIVSGPAGTGKGTICNEIIKKYPDQYALSISATSRGPRHTEVDGREYFFKTREEFEEMIRNDQLLEYARYLDNYYGTPREWVEKRIEEGINVILEIDVQGGFQIKEIFPDTLLIFVMPPDMEELRNRLIKRGTETPEQIEKRIGRAEEEIKISENYDYVIVNEDVEKSVEMLHNIVQLNKERLSGDK